MGVGLPLTGRGADSLQVFAASGVEGRPCDVHCICSSGLLSASDTLYRIARPGDRTRIFNGSEELLSCFRLEAGLTKTMASLRKGPSTRWRSSPSSN